MPIAGRFPTTTCFICRLHHNGHGKETLTHDYGHDLLKLFDALSAEARDVLEACFPMDVIPPDLRVFGPVPTGMRRTLEIHRHTFVHWRYAHENPEDRVWLSALDAC